MKTKLWQKTSQTASENLQKVEQFTIGNDNELDMFMAAYDVLGTLAHIEMLESVGLLQKEELSVLQTELKKLFNQIQNGQFKISEGVEDIHSEVEFQLTEKLGDLGKKVHSGRSRNDQVLVDIKMYSRARLESIVKLTNQLFEILLVKSEENKAILLPGYTHFQIAMLSSAGLWLSAYAESLTDDMELLYSAFKVVNKNPLGSGAGYGGSLPINRTKTTNLLGFETLNYNSVYAQMTRGKTEKTVASALSSLAATLSRLSMDCTLYLSQNFDFIAFPNELTTGSSIMPHKKNPDVFELIRAKCNKIQSYQTQFFNITNNLPSGYHRDMQILKDDYFAMFDEISSCLEMMIMMIQNISFKENILNDPRYLPLFSVEAVNQLVSTGIPFRIAYQQVGLSIENGTFEMPKLSQHTHEGSKDNLCLDEIRLAYNQTIQQFPFDKINQALAKLLKE